MSSGFPFLSFIRSRFRESYVSSFFGLILLLTLGSSPLLAAQKRVLILMPGGSHFNPSVVEIISALQKEGVEVVITTPPGSGPDWQRWGRLKIGLSLYKPWNTLRAERVQPELFEKSAEFDGAIFLGGPAQFRPPTGAERQPLNHFINAEDFQQLAEEFMKKGKPVAALSHGVELLARANTLESGHSILMNRKITGPSYALDLRRPFVKILLGGASATEAEIRAILGEHFDNFIPGPTTTLETLRGFVVQDKNLLTARSARDALRLGSEFIKLLNDPKASKFRRYFVEYPLEKDKTRKVWLQVIELAPPSFRKDYFIEYSGKGNPLDDPQIRNTVEAAYSQRNRVILWSLPGSGQNYGISNHLKLWTPPELAKLRTYMKEKLQFTRLTPSVAETAHRRYYTAEAYAFCARLIARLPKLKRK